MSADEGGGGGGGTVYGEGQVPPAMPLPLSGTRFGEVEAELRMVRVPGRAPMVEGVKVTVMAQVSPAARVAVRQGTVMAKSLVGTESERLVTGALPVLERVKVRLAGEPTAMLPKLSEAGET